MDLTTASDASSSDAGLTHPNDGVRLTTARCTAYPRGIMTPKDTVKAMLKALPDVKEDGASLVLDAAWEVTMHAGRNGAPISATLVTKVTIENEYLVLETHKSQRIVMLIDEVRGFTAEPSTTDRKGRKTGFV
ncbi:MAG: hypothetical protein WCJ30_23230 [Deltaproteobacteria bacterium]